MNVLIDNTVLGDIHSAIADAETAGNTIDKIELSESEMEAFIGHPRFRTNIDKHYGAAEIDMPLGIIYSHNKSLPSSCYYKGVKIVCV